MEVGKHEEATEATGVVNANKNCKNKSNIELREIVVQDGILGTSLVSFCIMRFATSPLPSESEAEGTKTRMNFESERRRNIVVPPSLLGCGWRMLIVGGVNGNELGFFDKLGHHDFGTIGIIAAATCRIVINLHHRFFLKKRTQIKA